MFHATVTDESYGIKSTVRVTPLIQLLQVILILILMKQLGKTFIIDSEGEDENKRQMFKTMLCSCASLFIISVLGLFNLWDVTHTKGVLDTLLKDSSLPSRLGDDPETEVMTYFWTKCVCI